MKRNLAAVGLSALIVLLATACGGDWGLNFGEAEPDEVLLASGGQAMLPIVVAEEADPSVELAAEELADYLGRISGADFEVVVGGEGPGIMMGAAGDFDFLPVDVEFGDGVFDREDYLLHSTEEGLYIVGASSLAVRFGVWDLLYRLGHRQFFPTETWEVVPDKETLRVSVETLERPDFYNRQAPRGAMRMDVRPWAYEGWLDWQLRNRTTATFSLNTGHAYDTVIAANQAEFDNNPEYWGTLDGEPNPDAQPNVAHPEVEQMFIDHALSQFESDPDRHSVAMDPRDGNYWSEDAASLAIGGPSEQAIHIANRVAEAVVSEVGDDKFVGLYGYSHHSPPPKIDVHSNVIVSLATEYIRGGLTFEEMLDGWSEKTEMIGIREYYGLWEWHNSLPGVGAKAGDTRYLAETIPYYHKRGARFINAESNDTWGAYGLGYYLATRMLWDVSEAERVDELIDDFLEKAFGAAREPMGAFYELIDGGSPDPYVPERSRQLNDDMVGRMYRLLDQARGLADSEEVRARIDDLVLYTHYVELYRRFDTIEGPERQQAFDELVSYAWRIRHTMMAESVELTRYINRSVRTDDNLDWGPGYDRNGPADKHLIGADDPFSDSEIQTILEQGIANHQLLDLNFEPWQDSGVFEAAYLPAQERGGPVPIVGRGSVQALLATDDGRLPAFTVSAGHIFDDRGPAQWVLEDENGELIDFGEIVPNEEDHHFELEAPGPGIYQFTLYNASQGILWDYEPRGAKLTILAGGEYDLRYNVYDRLYFYVPQGTPEIYLAGKLLEGRYEFLDGDGEPIPQEMVDVVQDYTIIPVPEGQDGKIWSLEMRSIRAHIRFLNTPGYVAFSPDELILPSEVVDQL